MAPPEVVPRLVLALLVALTAGAAAWIVAASNGVTMDFEFYWRGARAYFDGADPYAFRPWKPGWPLGDRLFYPLPALLVLWPIAWLPERAGAALFIGIPAGLLAWRLSRDALWPLLLFATPSFAITILLGQWSVWLVLGMLAPWAGFTFLCKPSVGLGCLVARPSWGALIGCTALGLLSLTLWPRWPWAWHANLSSLSGHRPPIFTLWGCWIALALIRWRSRDTRLLVALAAVPQLLFFADQLPLMLVARDRREMALFVVAGWVVAVPWLASVGGAGYLVPWAAPYVLLGVYLPATYIVLRRG